MKFAEIIKKHTWAEVAPLIADNGWMNDYHQIFDELQAVAFAEIRELSGLNPEEKAKAREKIFANFGNFGRFYNECSQEKIVIKAKQYEYTLRLERDVKNKTLKTESEVKIIADYLWTIDFNVFYIMPLISRD
jgi:DNA repair photolyase